MIDLEKRKLYFLEKCFKKYGNRFDYSKANFINYNTEIIIFDKLHQKEFKRTPYRHLLCNDENFILNSENKKPYGYWNNKGVCYNESLKYASKREFYEGNHSAYYASVRNGWIDEFFIGKPQIKKYMSFDKPIHCVYVYEIKGYNTCYVGRTLQLNHRDKQHRNGWRRHKKINYDSLYNFCKEKNIQMPKPIVLVDNVTAIESQRLEDVYLKQYKANGWFCLNKGRTGVGVGSLGAIVKWSYEKCKEVSYNCKNKEQMRKKYPGAYRSSYVNKWLDEFFIVTKKSNGYWDVFENCQEEAKKWKNVKELSLKGGGAYNASRKNGWLDKLQFKG